MTHIGPFQPLPFCDSVKSDKDQMSLFSTAFRGNYVCEEKGRLVELKLDKIKEIFSFS